MSKYFQKKSESSESIPNSNSNDVGKSLEEKLLDCLKKFYKYDCFKSETQRKAILEISKREADVYVNNTLLSIKLCDYIFDFF